MTQKSLLQSAGDGTAVPSGYVGQVVTWSTAPGTFTVLTTETDWPNATFTLSPGVWLVAFHIQVDGRTPSGAGTEVGATVKVTNSSNVTQGELVCSSRATNVSQLTISSILSQSAVLNVTTETTYKIRSYRYEVGGNGPYNLLNSDANRSKFYAVRIA